MAEMSYARSMRVACVNHILQAGSQVQLPWHSPACLTARLAVVPLGPAASLMTSAGSLRTSSQTCNVTNCLG
jgi:hypothetical protein